MILHLNFCKLLVIIWLYCYPSTHLFTIYYIFKALNSLYCGDVLISNYSLTDWRSKVKVTADLIMWWLRLTRWRWGVPSSRFHLEFFIVVFHKCWSPAFLHWIISLFHVPVAADGVVPHRVELAGWNHVLAVSTKCDGRLCHLPCKPHAWLCRSMGKSVRKLCYHCQICIYRCLHRFRESWYFHAFATWHCQQRRYVLGCPVRLSLQSDIVTIISHKLLEQFR